MIEDYFCLSMVTVLVINFA